MFGGLDDAVAAEGEGWRGGKEGSAVGWGAGACEGGVDGACGGAAVVRQEVPVVALFGGGEDAVAAVVGLALAVRQ